MKDLDGEHAYLNDVVIFDTSPAAHFCTIRPFLERLRKQALKVSTSRVTVSTTHSVSLGYAIIPAGIRPNAD